MFFSGNSIFILFLTTYNMDPGVLISIYSNPNKQAPKASTNIIGNYGSDLLREKFQPMSDRKDTQSCQCIRPLI